MNLQERLKMIRAMEQIVRSINNMDMITPWLMCGIADGDINGTESDEDLEYYCKDDVFADLMALFMRIMRRATSDPDIGKEDLKAGNYILYCDEVISKKELY